MEPPAPPANGSRLSPIRSSTSSSPTCQRVGGDLRQRRPGAGADVGGVDLDDVPAVGRCGDPALRLAPARRIGGGRDAGADQPPALGALPGAVVATGPAEALGPGAQAGDQVAARPGHVPLGVAIGLVADPQLDGVDAQLGGELVHRRLEGEHARRLPRRAHDRRRRHVQAGQPVRRPPVRRGVEHPGRRRRLLGELADPRGVLDDLVADRREPPLGVRAEPEPLDGRRPVADEGEHLRPGQLVDHGAGRPPSPPGRRSPGSGAGTPSTRTHRPRTARSPGPDPGRGRTPAPARGRSCAAPGWRPTR